MLGFLKRLIQILLIGGLLVGIIYADSVPEPARPVAKRAQSWLIGADVSFPGFWQSWHNRFGSIGQLVPAVAQTIQHIPAEPPTITADSVLNAIVNTLFTQPAVKWEQIKHQLFGGS